MHGNSGVPVLLLLGTQTMWLFPFPPFSNVFVFKILAGVWHLKYWERTWSLYMLLFITFCLNYICTRFTFDKCKVCMALSYVIFYIEPCFKNILIKLALNCIWCTNDSCACEFQTLFFLLTNIARKGIQYLMLCLHVNVKTIVKKKISQNLQREGDFTSCFFSSQKMLWKQ